MAHNSPRGPKRCQSPEHAIAELAARQHGNITRTQLRALGISDQGIKHRLAVGRLHRRPQGITVHRCALTPLDITVQRGIRVTTAARALLDSAPRLSDAS